MTNAGENAGPEPRGRADAGPFLVFDVGPGATVAGGTYALDVSKVLQVIEPASLAPVPLAPAVVLGILNHHGRIITVVDPAPLLGLTPQEPPVAQVVVLRQTPRGTPNLGLQVSRSHGIVPKAELAVAEVPASAPVAWVAQSGRRLIHILELEPLLQRLGQLFGPMDNREGLQGVTP